MKLTRRRDDARTFAEGERREPPREELVRVLADDPRGEQIGRQRLQQIERMQRAGGSKTDERHHFRYRDDRRGTALFD